MAHFAKIENNLVVGVYVVGDEYEDTYAANRAEVGETYIQTSYNNRIRKNFAGIGFTYDPTRDAFIPPQCHPSAVLNEETCRWICEEDIDETLSL